MENWEKCPFADSFTDLRTLRSLCVLCGLKKRENRKGRKVQFHAVYGTPIAALRATRLLVCLSVQGLLRSRRTAEPRTYLVLRRISERFPVPLRRRRQR